MATAMQAPLQIAFHNLDASEAVKGLIEDRVAWLERFCGRITGCRVVVEAPHRHNALGKPYEVRIDLTVPGNQIVVQRQSARQGEQGDLATLIREAFDVALRRLETHLQRQRGS
jgi:ribosome-associated translation inhibitor RaiA